MSNNGGDTSQISSNATLIVFDRLAMVAKEKKPLN
jgi:hypothetical protein